MQHKLEQVIFSTVFFVFPSLSRFFLWASLSVHVQRLAEAPLRSLQVALLQAELARRMERVIGITAGTRCMDNTLHDQGLSEAHLQAAKTLVELVVEGHGQQAAR